LGFLGILALELFFNRLRNGWLHTVRVVLLGFGLVIGCKRYRAVTLGVVLNVIIIKVMLDITFRRLEWNNEN
jgi:hypothetical protein